MSEFIIENGILRIYRGNEEVVAIPDGVTEIGEYAFFDCRSLTSVTIPASVKSIGRKVFEYCVSLKKINITDISAWCEIDFAKYENFPLGYTHDLYLNDELVTELVIPDGVTNIKKYAFNFCTSLKSVTIPASVKSIERYAFDGCSSLEKVYITDISSWCEIEFENYSSNPLNYATNLYLNDELITELVIPYGVTNIKNYTFCNCQSLTSVILPDSVTRIEAESFRDCSSLESIAIPNSVVSIGTRAFYWCSSLATIIFSNSVTTIGVEAFSNCESLKSITIPNSVTNIGGGAFEGCKSLKSITIPDSIVNVGYDAFKFCFSLKKVNISDISAWCKINFKNSDSNPLNYANYLYLNNKLVTELLIPDGVTLIEKYAFFNCKSLNSIIIPDSVESIRKNAFCSCTALTKVMIPDCLTDIEENAFDNCKSLNYYYVFKYGKIVKNFVETWSEEFEKLYSMVRVKYTIIYHHSDWADGDFYEGWGDDYDNSYTLYREPERKELLLKDGELYGFVTNSVNCPLIITDPKSYDPPLIGWDSWTLSDESSLSRYLWIPRLEADSEKYEFSADDFPKGFVKAVVKQIGKEDSKGFFDGSFDVTIELTDNAIANPDATLSEFFKIKPGCVLVKKP